MSVVCIHLQRSKYLTQRDAVGLELSMSFGADINGSLPPPYLPAAPAALRGAVHSQCTVERIYCPQAGVAGHIITSDMEETVA